MGMCAGYHMQYMQMHIFFAFFTNIRKFFTLLFFLTFGIMNISHIINSSWKI